MTIAGWIILVAISAFVILAELAMVYPSATTRTGRAISIVITVVLILALLFGMLWYFNNTTSGQRALVDQKSELGGGLDRTITIYTANGDVIAQYSGKIDLEANDGGYVKFDFDGNRYIYYNCFVESIAKIN